jgi:hypothetical protein
MIPFELETNGRLSAVKFTTVQTDIDLRQVKNNKFGDFATAQLARYNHAYRLSNTVES